MNPSIFADAVALPQALVAPAGFRPFEWAWLDESIPACFARQVAAHPQVIAVQTAGASLTYEQLGRQANHLTSCLLDRLGHDPAPVAILAGNDLNAVVAMMGILTAGKFFVTINPTSTQHEMREILADSGARAIVIDGQNAAIAASLGAAEQVDFQLLPVDSLPVDGPDAVPAVPMTAATLAQIAYTSGSTGRPKGILKNHRALLHQSMTHINGYFIAPGDRMMAPAPLIFGASLGIVFSALLGGATLLPIRLKEYTAAQLGDWLRAEQVTVYHSVASFFRQFAATLDTGESFPDLRVIKLGGETIQPEDLRLYRRSFAEHCVLRIGLASTEAGNYCWHFVGKESALDGPTVPVGRPLVGTELLLLDEDRVAVAAGEIGEIAVKSTFLALGYWNNPELTRTRFLPDPIEPQKTIYLTGDLGRWREDGLLEHLGRADQMVKIRGNRVELGAVEAALLALPAIQAAAVLAVSGAGDDKRLVAYLMPNAERLTTGELRAQLGRSLPDFMLPARAVWLDKMPLLPSGKIDRAALPAPGAARPELDTPFVAPRTEPEQQLTALWAELLELDGVGVEDNFFELGGDSILALRMGVRSEEQIGIRLSPEFFSKPSISTLTRLPNGVQAADNVSAVAAPAALAENTVRPVARTGKWQTIPDYRSARSRLLQGPTLNGWAMPYAAGIRLQRLWLRIPGFRALLMQKQLARLAVWRHVAATPAEWQVVVDISLAANTWGEWRKHALSTPAMQQRWIVTQVAEEADRILHSAHPVILVDNHSPVQWATRLVYGARDVGLVRVRNSGYWIKARLHADFARQMFAARAALAHSRPVLIAGDGFDGWQGVDVPFFGHTRRFRAGAAALAVETGAALIPVFTTLRRDGTIVNELLPPLASEQSSHAAQVENLTRQYAACYLARWPGLLASLQWVQLAKLNHELGLAGD